MVQPSLLDAPVSRQSLCDKLAAHFKAHEGEWLDGRLLATIAGAYGWRSRVSNVRKAPYHMRIDNRQRVQCDHSPDCIRTQFWDASEIDAPCYCGKPRRFTISEYRYVREDA